MHKDEITQGTIINGIRSDSYPNISCLGIVISARCDIANCKIPKIHLLAALPAEQWINTVGFRIAIEELLKSRSKELQKWAEKSGLNFFVLEKFSLADLSKNIEAVEKKKKQQESLLAKWREYFELCSLLGTSTIPYEHQYFVEIQNKAKEKLKEIISERNTHFCFIPTVAYNHTQENDTRTIGIVIDLLDVYQYSTELMFQLQNNKIDVMVLSEEEKIELNKKFYLVNTDDFVTVISQIASPWIEWLMQRFSFSFTRIGVDKPSDEFIDQFFTKRFGKEA